MQERLRRGKLVANSSRDHREKEGPIAQMVRAAGS